MATLILSAAGTALGGPIGGALGSFVGQAIDQQLFTGGSRKGPRLGDLSIQTSTYGASLPRIYGKMRVAGSVVWATDLQEIEAVEGGGKGSPQRAVYHYSANFAVALSSRPIRSVRRIWADGKLIRGAAGDFKIATKFRFLTGAEDQPVDPLIASAETIALTPAYRGMALAVFEGMDLAEFGNRIPSLTFEIEADEATSLGQVLLDASGGLIDANDARPIAGFAAYGGSIREGLASLVNVAGVDLIERDGRLMSPESIAPLSINPEELGCDADGASRPRIERIRGPESALPTNLSLGYYDATRDYQAGRMHGSTGRGGMGHENIDLPAVVDGGTAKAMAEQCLARRWRAADRLRLRLPPSRMGLQPGQLLTIEGVAGHWSARAVSIEGMAVAIEAETASAIVPPLAADPGRGISEPDLTIGRTELLLFELPTFDDQPAAAIQALVAGSNQGLWRQVPIELMVGTSPLPGRSLKRRAVLGRAESVLDPRCPLGVDELSSVDVRLTNADQLLFNADLDGLAGGANLALIGEELVQFARARQMGPGRYRLSSLLRGMRATEWAVHCHAEGDAFCMVDANCIMPVELPASATNAELRCTGHGVADFAPLPIASRLLSGGALQPPSPCKLTATRTGAQIVVEWVRRSFRQWHWIDGIGDVADAFPELYRITIATMNSTRILEVAGQSALLAPPVIPDQAGQPISISVATVGPSALSHPITTTIVT